jgi:hypothetical protein
VVIEILDDTFSPAAVLSVFPLESALHALSSPVVSGHVSPLIFILAQSSCISIELISLHKAAAPFALNCPLTDGALAGSSHRQPGVLGRQLQEPLIDYLLHARSKHYSPPDPGRLPLHMAGPEA